MWYDFLFNIYWLQPSWFLKANTIMVKVEKVFLVKMAFVCCSDRILMNLEHEEKKKRKCILKHKS